jgi:predicted S18 family serine protease
MKKLLVTISLLAVAVSPALAKGKAHRGVSTDRKNIATSVGTSRTVVAGGIVLGSDPDPAIRFDLLRQGDSVWNGEN